MKRPEPESPEAERRSQRAADWLVRRDRGLTAAEQDEFLQWLAIDPRHGEWFALHRSVVGEFSALAQWRPEHSEEPNPDLLAPPRRGIHWLVPTLLAAAAAVALAEVCWRSTPAPASVAAIASSELKRRILEDGSSVEPNHGAVVTTEFTAMERRATLVRGEALFTVAKESSRPFIVRAGGVDVVEQRVAHARIPIGTQMVTDAFCTPFRRIRREEIADLVGHQQDPVKCHHRHSGTLRVGKCHGYSAGSSRSASSDASSVGALIRTTSTAVTLYSGQLVAQSERSEVTAFAFDLA